MPTYQIYVNKSRIKDFQKQALAKAVTDAHVGETGAPAWYVQVIFHCLDDIDHYVGGKMNGDIMWIRGDVRPRDEQSNKKLMLALVEAAGNACDIDKDHIWVDLAPVEPSNIVKFRKVLPPAGGEQAWFDSLPDHIREKISNT